MEYVFKSCHFSDSAVLRIQNDILCYLNSVRFHTVDHMILLNFLEHHILICCIFLNVFKCYVADQTHSLVIHSESLFLLPS